MNRPTGVTIVATLCLLYAVALFGLAIVAYNHPEVLGNLHIANGNAPPNLRNAGAGTFISFAPLIATYAIVVGIGLIFLRKWARWAILILVGLSLARQLSLLAGMMFFLGSKFTLTPAFAVSIFINAAIVYYFTRPAVRASFGEGTDSRVYSK